MTVFNTSATVAFLLCEISPKCGKKKEDGIFYGTSPLFKKKSSNLEDFFFHHICTSTCNWNISGFY
jgi:hypothetical protein